MKGRLAVALDSPQQEEGLARVHALQASQRPQAPADRHVVPQPGRSMCHRRHDRARGALEPRDCLEKNIRIGKALARLEELRVLGQVLEVGIGTVESFRDRLCRGSNGCLDIFRGPGLGPGAPARALLHVVRQTLLRVAAE